MFEPFDKVKIRPDLAVGATYDGVALTPSMAKYRGQTTRIYSSTDWHGGKIYLLEADGRAYWYSEKMLQAVKE